MFVLEIVIIIIALAATSLLFLHQVVTQVKEYLFYRDNGWNFSVDSGLHRIDERAGILYLSNWQRFYLYRPATILALIWMIAGMIWSLF